MYAKLTAALIATELDETELSAGNQITESSTGYPLPPLSYPVLVDPSTTVIVNAEMPTAASIAALKL